MERETQKTMKKKLMDRPILAGIILFFAFQIILNVAVLPFIVVPKEVRAVSAYSFLILLFIVMYAWFRKVYKNQTPHVKPVGSFLKGILYTFPIWGYGLVSLSSAIPALAEGALPADYVIKSLFVAMQAGVCEEVMFRGIIAGNGMRVNPSKDTLMKWAWLSSILFGLVHAGNLLSGAGIITTISQIVYAMGIGMLLCAVFFRTGNIVPCIIAHFVLDAGGFLGQAAQQGLGEAIGIAKDTDSVGKAIVSTGITVLITFGCAFFLLRKNKRDAIVANFAVEK